MGEFEDLVAMARRNGPLTTGELLSQQGLQRIQAQRTEQQTVRTAHAAVAGIRARVTAAMVSLHPPVEGHFIADERSRNKYNKLSGRVSGRADRYFDRHSIGAWDMCTELVTPYYDPEAGNTSMDEPMFLGEDGVIYLRPGSGDRNYGPNDLFLRPSHYQDLKMGLANLVARHNLAI